MKYTIRSVKRRVKRRASKSVKRKLKQRQSRRHNFNKVMSGGGGNYTNVTYQCHVCNLKEVETNKGILGLHNLVAEMIVTFDKDVPIRYTLLTNPLQCVSMKKADEDNCLDFQIEELLHHKPSNSALAKESRSLKYPPELFNLVHQLNPFPPYTIDGYDLKIAFKKLLEHLIKVEHIPKISGVVIPEYKATHGYREKCENIMKKVPIQSVSIEKSFGRHWGKVFKLSCYDGKSYESTVRFTEENPFYIQFVKTTPSYSIPLVQSSSPPEVVPVVQTEFENKDNEIDYGFYISTSRASGHINEKEGNANEDYANLISSTCQYNGPLKNDLTRYGGGYQTEQGKMTLEKYARKVPTKNEKKLMEWNKQIYEQEEERATKVLEHKQELAEYAKEHRNDSGD